MATWVIGDVHGCWRTLQALLESIEWRPEDDELWFVGDLVNRGPWSLEVLRWAYEQRSGLKIVLGNHDLHLLARAAGVTRAKSDDTLDDILHAPDRDFSWTGCEGGHWSTVRSLSFWSMPGWCPTGILHRSASWPMRFRAGSVATRSCLLEKLYRRRAAGWQQDLAGEERLAAAAAVFTRTRMVDEDGWPQLGPGSTG